MPRAELFPKALSRTGIEPKEEFFVRACKFVEFQAGSSYEKWVYPKYYAHSNLSKD